MTTYHFKVVNYYTDFFYRNKRLNVEKKEKKFQGVKVKHKILWLSYIAFIRPYETVEKTNKNIHCKGSYTYTIDKA